MPIEPSTHALIRAGAGLTWALVAVGAYFGWMGLLAGGFNGYTPAWQWLAPFVGAAVMYLFGSTLALLASHPWRWLGGATVMLVFLRVLAEQGVLRAGRGVWYLFDAPYGLLTVLTGKTRDPIFAIDVWFSSLSAWLVAALIWLTVAGGAFVLAAHWQPES